jgi:predicted RecB family nuclease
MNKVFLLLLFITVIIIVLPGYTESTLGPIPELQFANKVYVVSFAHNCCKRAQQNLEDTALKCGATKAFSLDLDTLEAPGEVKEYIKNNKRDLKLIDNDVGLLRGFNLLPERSDGDIFFDMESVQDYVYPGGLEYLFGLYYSEDGKEKFKAFWAHNKTEEKKSVVNFFDFLKKHFEKYPKAYIYHYASYELTALNRLTSFHKIKNAEFDKYLRLEKFVDLFKIVKQSIQISENSYSLKFVEKFYDYKRTGSVVKADQSEDMYVQWVDNQDQKLLDQIEHYNKQD